MHDVNSFVLEYSSHYRERGNKIGKRSSQATVMDTLSPASDTVNYDTVTLFEPFQISEARSQNDDFMPLVDEVLGQLIGHFAGASTDRWKFVVGNQNAQG
jgi:hypothetical protein